MNSLEIEEINSCNFMSSILENMQDMVRVINRDDYIVFMNKVMRDKFGDFTGSKCYEMLNKKEECVNCISKQCINECTSQVKEQTINENIYSVISTPVWNSTCEEWYSVEVLRDITEQKRMEGTILNNYNKMIKDLTYARQMQEKIIPKNGIYGNCIRLASKYIPSEQLGGDVFDVFDLDEDNTAMYIADVSGHGVTASMFTMFLRQAIRSKKYKNITIEKTINHLIDDYIELNLDNDQYFTLLYAVYNKTKKELDIVNAGHNSLPIVIRKETGAEEIAVKGLPICSILEKFSHETIQINIEKGDKLILHTDGLVEIYNKETSEFFGSERLVEISNQLKDEEGEELVEAINKAAMDFSKDELKDDVAIAVLEFI